MEVLLPFGRGYCPRPQLKPRTTQRAEPYEGTEKPSRLPQRHLSPSANNWGGHDTPGLPAWEGKFSRELFCSAINAVRSLGVGLMEMVVMGFPRKVARLGKNSGVWSFQIHCFRIGRGDLMGTAGNERNPWDSRQFSLSGGGRFGGEGGGKKGRVCSRCDVWGAGVRRRLSKF